MYESKTLKNVTCAVDHFGSASNAKTASKPYNLIKNKLKIKQLN